MTTIRPFTCEDMLKFNNVNLDPLTETYGLSFYTQYLAHWPEYFQVVESANGEIMGYIMGKAEGHGDNWHGHVTALTVSPEYRRLGLAATLMNILEEVSEKKKAYFVDLFVRVSNKVAINMYKNLGYIVYRTVLEYYSGDPDEDAYDASTITRFYSNTSTYVSKINSYNQVDYMKSIDDTSAQNQDWLSVKNNILSMRGNLNKKNVDAVLLKVLVASKNLASASSFAQYLKSTQEELSLGCTNSILYMYSTIGKQRELTKEERKFILHTYNSLYEKYKVLDSSTSEQLLPVLCVINEWEKALKVLEEIHLSAVPSHFAYSTMIATLFRLNKMKKALDLIDQSVKHKRPLQHIAYEEWMKFIIRKYKDKKIIAKHLDDIPKHIETYWALIPENTAKQLRDLYISLDWESQFTSIRKSDGKCSMCKESLDLLTLSNEEFNTLQKNIKDKLIVGSDLLLKTTHDELKMFLDSVERFAPYDVVLDGLNISYAAKKGSHTDKLHLLEDVVDYFVNKNKKILLLGRQHMLRWNKKIMDRILFKTCSFLTENLSQDDPFFITAAILCGPHTDLVSKDLLRGHKFNLKDEYLKQLFKRWQWHHQWMIFTSYKKGLVVQPPLQFTPCAQKIGNTWHIPFESEAAAATALVNDGIPDLRSWLCLKQKL